MQIGLLSDKLLYSTPDIRVFAIHTTNNCKYPARYLILDKTGVVMICKICGKEFDSKGRHLRYYHNISNQEYYDKYILSNVSDKFCKICGKEKAFKSLNFGYRSCKKNESLCKDCYFKSEEYHIKEEYNKNRRKILNREKSKRNRKYKYVCKICNNGTDHMAYHLKNSHNMSYVDYCMQYYPEKLKSYCQKCGKKN